MRIKDGVGGRIRLRDKADFDFHPPDAGADNLLRLSCRTNDDGRESYRIRVIGFKMAGRDANRNAVDGVIIEPIDDRLLRQFFEIAAHP